MIKLNNCPGCGIEPKIQTKSKRGYPGTYIQFIYIVKCETCKLTMLGDDETSRNSLEDYKQEKLKQNIT